MGYEQIAEKCSDHPDCVRIVGVMDGRVVSRSHMPANVEPDVRLNLDHPRFEDGRGGGPSRLPWRLAELAEVPLLGWDDVEHRKVAYLARERGLVSDSEIQSKTGANRSQLDLEAGEKGWRDADRRDAARRKPE